MKFEYLKDVAIADLAFRAEGKTIEDLLANCALALTSAMADVPKIKAKVNKKITVGGRDDKELLYKFLSELVYIKDVDGLLFRNFEVKIRGSGSKTGWAKNKKKSNGQTMTLSAKCVGDTLDGIGRQNLGNDVKAITMHMFEVKQEKGKWAAVVVVDI